MPPPPDERHIIASGVVQAVKPGHTAGHPAEPPVVCCIEIWSDEAVELGPSAGDLYVRIQELLADCVTPAPGVPRKRRWITEEDVARMMADRDAAGR